MADRQKLIGVCLSEAHSVLNTGFLSELNYAAAAEGYSPVLFNSTPNPYRGEGTASSRALYRSIQFPLYDAIVIIYYSLRDRQLLDEIVTGARRRSVPVISIGEEIPGCWSIVNDYRDSYRALLRHVILDHGAKDTFYIAGPEGEATSRARVDCYRETLEECGLPFRPERVCCGDYMPDRAAEIVRKLIRGKEPLPRAIFCANDEMAIAVCDTLKKSGYKVPEDVIVTGFDGIPAAFMVSPRLTTCGDDPGFVAHKTMELVKAFRAGKHPPRHISHRFRPVLSESCGCPAEANRRFDALTLFRRSERLNRHENDLALKKSILASEHNPDVFWERLSRTLLPDSELYINRSFMDIYDGKDFTTDSAEGTVVVLPSRTADEPFAMKEAALKALRPHGGRRTGTNILNMIYADSRFCGVYAVHTNDPEGDAQLIRRMSDSLGSLLTLHLSLARQQMLITNLKNTLFLDAATGLSNLRGLKRWFEGYTAEAGSHERPLSLSVYSINHYTYIFETYGMEEIESIVSLVTSRLTAVNEDALVTARISDEQFVVVNSGDSLEALRADVDRCINQFYRNIETHNSASSKPYYIEVNCGCTAMDSGWEDTSLESLIHLALGEMYLNNMRSSAAAREANRPTGGSSAAMFSAFSLLMEKNLLKFHFQPIVSARTAQIIAYEALMRADSLIQLTPLDILAVAREYHQLYEVEKRTVFGIIEQYVRNSSDFAGCRLFINTIPGHFLNDADCAELKKRYESYLNCFVFELTEQDPTSDEELARLKGLGKADSPIHIAIDDYGTGHSNMVNVLRYAPQIIKIDRELISGIRNDSNKQLFVRNTIDFAHQNHIQVLAEGVETDEELRAVIDYGIDYIQGYFTGRPAERPLRNVAESVRNIILEENLIVRRMNSTGTIHTAADGEAIDLIAKSIDGCSCIQVTGGTVTLKGHIRQSIDMSVHIADGTTATLVLAGVNLSCANESIIQLGADSDLTLVLRGENRLDKEGIHVPASARLTVTGDGSLDIVNSRNFAVGIGTNYNDPYGTIILDLDGSLSIHSTGDRIVCLGGGRSAGEGIRLLRGSFSFEGHGISALAVGSTGGIAQIEIAENASAEILLESNEAVGLGTVSGELDFTCAGRVNVSMKCERCVGIGSLTGSGQILLDGGCADLSVRCDKGACIGTFDGETAAVLRNSTVRLHGEGNRVAGLGSPEGAGDTRIESGHVSGEILAAESLLLGNSHSRVIITGGNVCLTPAEKEGPVSPGGLPLHPETPDTDHYEKSFRDRRGSWTYTADRDEDGRLTVWVPEGSET